MSTQPKKQIENKEVEWSSHLRPKVGSTVKHNNKFWINLTGLNSEPSDSSDDWSLADSEGDTPRIDEVLSQGNEMNAGQSLEIKSEDETVLYRLTSDKNRIVFQFLDESTWRNVIIFNKSGLTVVGNSSDGYDGLKVYGPDGGSSISLRLLQNAGFGKVLELPPESGILTLDPGDEIPKVRIGNNWRDLHKPKTRVFDWTGANSGSSYTLQDIDHTILFLTDSQGDLSLPDPSLPENNEREIRLIIHRTSNIGVNRDIYDLSGSVEYSSSTPIDTSSSHLNGGGSLTLQVIKNVWQIVQKSKNA